MATATANNGRTAEPVPAPAPASETSPLADLMQRLDQFTEKDLEALDAEIARQENQLNASYSLRHVIEARLGKTPKKVKRIKRARPAAGSPEAPADATADDDNSTLQLKRRKVLLYLHKNGSRTLEALANQCNINTYGRGAIATVVRDCPWFRVTEGGSVQLTDAGRAEAQRAASLRGGTNS